MEADKSSDWTPPTPQSILVPITTKQLLLPSFALPDASLPTRHQPESEFPAGGRKKTVPPSSALIRLLNPDNEFNCAERATPNNISSIECAGNASEYFQEIPQVIEASAEAQDHPEEITSLPSNDDDEDQDPSYTSSESLKRPRRDAAVTAARLIPRQPSPFELSPPPSRGSSGNGSQSNRKVSHSLIERRRRERINDCLSHLKQLVPQCRAEGEKKVARAKERGRKRGRKGEDDVGDEGQRGGLHKLEILQGTIRYLEELEARVAVLDGRLHTKDIENVFTGSTTASPSAEQPPSGFSAHLPSVTADSEGIQIVYKTLQHHPEGSTSSSARSSVDQATAELLLNLSTSPELRPVIYD